MKSELHAERLLNVAQIASFLQVPQSWVYGKVASGEIPHVRVGRYVRFRMREVLDWLGDRGR